MDWDKLISAAIGLVAGTAGSLIAPWVNWRIEKKRIELAHKRATLAAWRQMVADVIRASEEQSVELQVALERHPDFYSLRPHLSADTVQGLFGRTFMVPRDRSTVDGAIASLLGDIDRVERTWEV